MRAKSATADRHCRPPLQTARLTTTPGARNTQKTLHALDVQLAHFGYALGALQLVGFLPLAEPDGLELSRVSRDRANDALSVFCRGRGLQ